MLTRVLCALITVAVSLPLHAQEQAATGVERETSHAHSWRLLYENDFFAATDRYYTQGIYLEFVHPALARSPIRHVLIAPSRHPTRFGLAFGDEGYTGSDLKQSVIVPGDHPWAGTKQLHAFAIATDTIRHRRLSSQLTVGLIGQGAAGREIQTFIHERTGNTIPQGWHNQIRNDLILNYAVLAEQRVAASGKSVELWTSLGARAGTFQTSLSAGSTLLAGRIGRWHAYAAPSVRLVGYEATLQGGLFNRDSPYTIGAGDLHRVVYAQRLGLVYSGDRVFVEFFRAQTGREFAGGRTHRTGGIAIGTGRR
jgi:hypothetical protein